MNISYFTNFLVYVFAMSGVLLTAVFIYKKFGTIAEGKEGKVLKIKDRLSIAPRKTLYIVQAGEESFLIAGDTDRTTMLAKLNSSGNLEQTPQYSGVTQEDIQINNQKIMQRLNERFRTKE